jgi:hypothetical protein
MGLDHSEVMELVGQESAPIRALDAVSKSDLRHWCELIGDPDPAYGEKIKKGEKTAPPAMLMAWTMDPLWPPKEEACEPHERLAKLFDEAGYAGATAIGIDQEFIRPVEIGDRLSFKVKILKVSPDEEQTKLGRGYLLRLLYTLVNQDGEVVSRQNYTVLRYQALTPQLG